MRTFRLQFPLLQLVRELGKREIPITPSFPFSGPLAMTTARPTWTKVSNPIVVDVPRVRLLSKSRLSLSSSPRNNPTYLCHQGLLFKITSVTNSKIFLQTLWVKILRDASKRVYRG